MHDPLEVSKLSIIVELRLYKLVVLDVTSRNTIEREYTLLLRVTQSTVLVRHRDRDTEQTTRETNKYRKLSRGR